MNQYPNMNLCTPCAMSHVDRICLALQDDDNDCDCECDSGIPDLQGMTAGDVRWWRQENSD